MSQTALIIKDESREKIYSLNLNMYLNTDVISKSSVSDFVKLIEALPKLDLVIIDEADFLEADTNAVIVEIKKRQLHIPVIVLTKRTQTISEEILISISGDIKPLLQVAAKKLGITALDMANLRTPEYIPFQISFFEIIDFTPCALMILKDKNYIPFKDSKKPFVTEELNQLKSQKIQYIYIHSKDRLRFTNFITEQMDKKLKETKAPAEKLADTQVAVQVTQQYIREMGLDDTAIKMTKSCIESMQKITKSVSNKSSTLDKLLGQLLNNQSSYNFTHSQLTALLACHAIGQMTWGSEEQQEKIVFISFFHNILLKDDSFCKIETEDELKALNIPQKDKDDILKHAQNTALLLATYPKVPLGCDDLVKQHHGSRNGIGFPDQASASTSPLAMVFYVSEMLAHALLKRPFDQLGAFEKINLKAPKGTKTKSIIEAFEKLDFNKFL